MNTLPQGLANLPKELILLIFNFIKLITDKRQFLRTCVLYNKITYQSMANFENNYTIKHFDKINYYCMEKFTLELCHDKYFDMIPNSYINKNNNIIGKALGAFYDGNFAENINYSLFDYCKYPFVLFNKLFIGYDNPNILELAKINGCDLNKSREYAAMNGNLYYLKWEKENISDNNRIYDITRSSHSNACICSEASEYGHLEVLKWAKENMCHTKELITLKNITRNGHLYLLKWAKEENLFFDDNICFNAALSGHLEILKWARKNGCNWDKTICSSAASRGNLEVLKWARENGCDWDENTCIEAVGDYEIRDIQNRKIYASNCCKKNGVSCDIHLEVLKWARKNGCDWNSRTCVRAAKTGRLKILKWARKNGCGWNSDVCVSAAFYGHFEVLKWARENGCDWNESVIHYARLRGHYDILKWAVENGCP